MKMQTSNKVAQYEKKVRIEKGYYAGQLTEAKPRQKDDGTPFEGKYGRQIIMMVKVIDKKTMKPLTTTKDNIVIDLELPLVLNSEYKEKQTGNYRTAITPNAYITKVLRCFGWEGKLGEEIDFDKLAGHFAEINVDDYDAEMKNENDQVEKYKASCIKDVNKLEGAIPSSSSNPKQVEANQSFMPSKPEVITGKEMKGMVCNSCYRRNDCHALPNEYNKSLTGEVVDCKIYCQEEQVKDEELKKDVEENKKELQEIRLRKEEMTKLHDAKLLTDGGYQLAMEGLEKREAMLR